MYMTLPYFMKCESKSISTAPGCGVEPPGAAGGVLAVPGRAVRAADQAAAQAGARH